MTGDVTRTREYGDSVLGRLPEYDSRIRPRDVYSIREPLGHPNPRSRALVRSALFASILDTSPSETLGRIRKEEQ